MRHLTLQNCHCTFDSITTPKSLCLCLCLSLCLCLCLGLLHERTGDGSAGPLAPGQGLGALQSSPTPTEVEIGVARGCPRSLPRTSLPLPERNLSQPLQPLRGAVAHIARGEGVRVIVIVVADTDTAEVAAGDAISELQGAADWAGRFEEHSAGSVAVQKFSLWK